MKKLSLRGNNVLVVLWLNTLFSTLLLSPVLISGLMQADSVPLGGDMSGHMLMVLKAVIVLGSWILGYFAIKHLPLTIQGPVNAARPVLVLIGAVIVWREQLNAMQWAGAGLGVVSLLLVSLLGARESNARTGGTRWVVMALGATCLGAVSALYDKYLAGRFSPLEVQAWYSLYQLALMSVVVAVLLRCGYGRGGRFVWRWSIVGISIFLTAADLAYFHALSEPEAMIAVVSMLRRGSVLVSFVFGVAVLHERHVRAKLVDLALLLVSLLLLALGSR